ncbi:MAG: histidinol dehydrogenase, partial [Syntrophobacteria bacterium]
MHSEVRVEVLTYPSATAQQRIEYIINRTLSYSETQERAVAEIIEAVRTEGDAALLRYTRQFDAPEMSPEQIRIKDAEIAAAAKQVDPEVISLIQRARDNISRFHEAQRRHSWILPCVDGSILGQMTRPVAAAGLYIPGGRAGETPLISSLLMNAVPAIIAGVPRQQVVTPPRRDGSIDPHLLVTADLLGLREIYKVGSAWAIAALAYGTETIPAVDVIVGPGNIYVTLAKKLVTGRVGIDLVAGPSEILIIADSSADPRHIAADLLSQAEHDPMASALMLTPDDELAHATCMALQEQLALLPRRRIAQDSLD